MSCTVIMASSSPSPWHHIGEHPLRLSGYQLPVQLPEQPPITSIVTSFYQAATISSVRAYHKLPVGCQWLPVVCHQLPVASQRIYQQLASTYQQLASTCQQLVSTSTDRLPAAASSYQKGCQQLPAAIRKVACSYQYLVSATTSRLPASTSSTIRKLVSLFTSALSVMFPF